MNLFVVSAVPNPPALLALRMEGFDPVPLDTAPDFAYGHHFTHLWNEGKPFITVEHDVVPWPGAIDQLMACPEPWCTHRFPNGANLIVSFGIGKYTPRGPAPESWSRVADGRYLDGEVLPYLQRELGYRPHVHDPPVAHCRLSSEGAIRR